MWGRNDTTGLPLGELAPDPFDNLGQQSMPSRYRVIVFAPEQTCFAPTRSLTSFRLLLPAPSPIRVGDARRCRP
jgi:hypothetical protein